jgi:hypothetical protein
MKNTTCCLTISPRNLIYQALTTAKSFLEFNTEFSYYIFVTDREPLKKLQLAFPKINFRNLDSLSSRNLDELINKYSDIELAYAITPLIIKHLLSNDIQSVLFLKIETFVLGNLNSLINLLKSNSVIITPHLLSPILDIDILDQEVDVMMAGIYNGGVIGFSNTIESKQFLTWWSQKTELDCSRNNILGIHYEQSWLNFLPMFIKDLFISRDKGINVAHWNLHERNLHILHGKIYCGDDELLIFRFSGYDETNPNFLSKYKPNLYENKLGPAKLIFENYKQELKINKEIIRKIQEE